MQSDLFIEVLVLQSEQLMRILVNPFILFQTAPGGVFAEPQELAVLIGHLTWDDDLVAVEVVGLLAAFSFFVDVVLIGETACVPHVPYVKTEDFVRATACWFLTIFQQFFFM